MEFGLLGPLLIRRDGEPVEVGAPKQRTLLIHLLLRVNRTVPMESLIDALWEDDPPPQARVTLRSYVSSLRRVLDEPGAAPVIVTSGNGYSVQVAPESIDAVRFERLVDTARRDVAAGDPQAALNGLEEGLALWRGEALADVPDSGFARGERTRLEELRLAAEEDRFDALLASGRHGEAVASLEAFTAAEPLRERARAQLMLGLYRSGRAADALAAFRSFRQRLVDELGLDPSPKLQELADRILNQAADLDLSSPAVTMAVTPRRQQRAVGQPSLLVGRVHERRELQACTDRLLAGDGDLLLVAGEPGIGKTALLEELDRLATAAGVTVHWGRCHETEGAPAFWPWIQILRSIAAARSDDELRALASGAAGPVSQLVDDIAQRLGERDRVLGDDPEAARFQLYDAIATFLVRVSEQRPLVLMLDDLHWADTPSLQTLAFLTPLLGSGSLLVAGSYRDVHADWTAELEATLATVAREPSTRQLGLAGLQPQAVAELAERLTGRPVSGEELGLLHQRTAGNPFFVRQLSQLLDEADSGRGGMTIPAGVRHVIARRLSLLPAEVRELLEVAAVIGAEFDLRQLAAAAGTAAAEALEAAGRAVAHGLLVADDERATGYRFTHALVRETVYDSLPPHRRTRLHAHVAGVLEGRPGVAAAELAEHFWHAADLIPDDRPVRYLVAAADEALEVLAYEQAETFLRRALGLLASRADDPATELRVRVQLVRLLISVHGWASGVIEEIAGPARQLVRTAGLAPGVVPLWGALLSTYTSRGEVQTADELAQELLAKAVAAGDPSAVAAGHVAVAYVHTILGRDLSGALEHAAQAEHHAQLAAPEDLQAVPHIEVAAIYTQAVALAYQGEGAAAMETALRAIALADQVADPFSRAIAHMVAGLVGVVVREPAFTAEVTAAGLALCDRHGYGFVRNLMTVSTSWAHARLGDDPGGRADTMLEAIGAMQRFGHSDPLAKYLVYTAETYLLAGDAQAARRCLEQARALSERTGEYLPRRRLQQLEADLAALAAGA